MDSVAYFMGRNYNDKHRLDSDFQLYISVSAMQRNTMIALIDRGGKYQNLPPS